MLCVVGRLQVVRQLNANYWSDDSKSSDQMVRSETIKIEDMSNGIYPFK